MDLALLFDVGFSTSYEIFHKVIKEWILDNRLVKINAVDFCTDEVQMSKVASRQLEDRFMCTQHVELAP